MTVRGTLKSDALVIARINIDFMTNPAKVFAAAALIVEKQIAQPIGWTESSSAWSPETLSKLRDLRESMERDLARALFVEGASDAPSPQPAGVVMPGGLSEHLTDGTRQV